MKYKNVQIYHGRLQVGQGGTGEVRREADGEEHLFAAITWNRDPVASYHTRVLTVKAVDDRGARVEENRELRAVEPKTENSQSNFGPPV